MEEKEKIYAVYVRVSTVEQALAKEGSIVSQTQRIREYLAFKYGSPEVKMYQDEGYSAKDTNRPAYQKLLRDIEKGIFQAVVCTEISRVSRSVIDFHQFIGKCNNNGVGFISLREQFDTTSAHGKLMLGIFASVAQFEREQISERTSANLQARARRGLFNGGYIYGYRPRPANRGYLDVDPQEAIVITLIFDKYLELASYCKVAEWLNKNGYRTREFTTRRGIYRKAAPWCNSSVLHILKNPFYIGKRRTGKEIVNAVWSPIVTKETFDKVQKLLSNNYEVRGNSEAEERYVYLFSGVMNCVHCEVIFENGSGTSSKNKLYFYYRHPHGKRKDDCPLPSSLPAQQIDKMIYRNLVSILDNDELLEMVCKEVSEKSKIDIGNISTQVEMVEKEISEIDAKSRKYLEKMLILDDNSVKEMVGPVLRELGERRKFLENRKKEFDVELTFLKSEEIKPDDIKNEIGSLSREFENLTERDKKKIMKMLVEKIDIHEDKMKMWVYVYKQKDHSPYNQVRMISTWLPPLVAQRTLSLLSFPLVFFFKIVISCYGAIFIEDLGGLK